MLLFFAASCESGIFRSPFGNRTLLLDTLSYDHTIITGVRNMNADASGNLLYQNKAGNYHDLNAKFLIKFTNFATLTGVPDSVELTINQANVLFYRAGYWGDESVVSLDLSLVENDTSLYWENISDVSEVFASLEGRTVHTGTVSLPTDADSFLIPIDVATVNDWFRYPDTFYVNNGFTVEKSDDSEGMIAFSTLEYSSSTDDRRPRLVLDCSLYDTNGVYLQDSLFYVYGSGDIQYAESSASYADSLFILAQGNIFRTYITLDSLREDTLLGPTHLLNKAGLNLVVDRDNSSVAAGDTLTLTARLFRTDHWDADSISYIYTAASDPFTALDDTLRVDISQLLQYLVSNPPDKDNEGVFFYLNNEYNSFNSIRIIPALSTLDIVYTKVRDE
ncbi:MAG: hypothetical protein JXR21_04045 [Candidatus Marinimicrobia bacterium]|nr:hypothetical protein [Candidatus Neomarinimicrobiota bacterium]